MFGYTETCAEEQQEDVEGENVEGMAGDTLSKKSEIPPSDYLLWRSHPTAAALERPEEHF